MPLPINYNLINSSQIVNVLITENNVFYVPYDVLNNIIYITATAGGGGAGLSTHGGGSWGSGNGTNGGDT
ncbi:MAG: hypothetical protein ACP5G1_03970, partial [Nanopusillaceae archaeon]